MLPFTVITSQVPSRARLQIRDAAVLVDLGPGNARRLGIGMGRAFGIEVAVRRIQHGADKILLLQKRIQRLGFLHRHHLGLKAEILGPRMGHLQPFQPLRRIRQDQPAGPVQPAGLAGNLLKLVVKADGVALQLRHIGIAVKGVETARRMPGGAGGEPVALDQHHVFPARLGEVIEHRAANHATPDDNDARLRFHVIFLGKK